MKNQIQCETKLPTQQTRVDSTGTYLLKSNNRNTVTSFEICAKLSIRTTEDVDVALLSL